MTSTQKILETRHGAWVLAGVDVEMEMVDAIFDLEYAHQENQEYNRKEIEKCKRKLKKVNDMLSRIERRMTETSEGWS
jgi:hypothetical protein